jgi:transposase
MGAPSACRRSLALAPLIATALLAAIGDIQAFKNGRELAAWLRLVPRQRSAGGKPTLLGISKRADVYLRQLIIHGARSIVGGQIAKPIGTASAELLTWR